MKNLKFKKLFLICLAFCKYQNFFTTFSSKNKNFGIKDNDGAINLLKVEHFIEVKSVFNAVNEDYKNRENTEKAYYLDYFSGRSHKREEKVKFSFNIKNSDIIAQEQNMQNLYCFEYTNGDYSIFNYSFKKNNLNSEYTFQIDLNSFIAANSLNKDSFNYEIIDNKIIINFKDPVNYNKNYNRFFNNIELSSSKNKIEIIIKDANFETVEKLDNKIKVSFKNK